MSKRRAHGEGSIRQRKDGRYEATISAGAAGGHKRSFYGKTKAEAVRKLNQARADLDAGREVTPARLTVSTILDDWLNAKRNTVRPRTWQRYDEFVRLHLRPQLGHIRASQFDPRDLDAMYARLIGTGLSPTTCGHLHRALHAALKLGMQRSLVHRNVAELTTAPSAAHHEVKPLTVSETAALISTADSDPLGALYIVAVTTGLREGELLGLKWSEVDFERGCLQVVGSLQRMPGKKLEIVAPKSEASRRTVHLPASASAALRRHRTSQAAERLRIGPGWNDLDLVFPNSLGLPINASNMLRRSFRPFLKQAGIRQIRFHDLRHTCATLHLSAGANIKVVAELLGHSDVTTTLRTYAHVMPTMQAEAVSAFDEQLKRAAGESP